MCAGKLKVKSSQGDQFLLKMKKGKVETAAASISPDVPQDFAKKNKIKQQQQQVHSLLAKMKSLLTDFQAAQSS